MTPDDKNGPVITSFIEVWLKPGEIEIIYRAYEMLSVLTPENTQIYIMHSKALEQGRCKIGLSYPLDNRKPHSYANSFTVSHEVAIADLNPEVVMKRLLDLAKRQQRRIKWEVTRARSRQWYFSGSNLKIDGGESLEFSKESVEAL